jgi:histidinol phosphatase-like PHP family hydrolase
MRNIELAELLAQESANHEGNKQKAARRASRHALSWPVEVEDVIADPEAKLTDLSSVGPWVARLIQGWVEEPPESIEVESDLREDFQTLSAAKERVAGEPEWLDELQGDLQMHSTYSDGSLSIQEMAMHALDLGYSYVAMTDHSKGLHIAGGMSEERLAEQGVEIDDLNRYFENSHVEFRVLKALEMNLSVTGEGDMEPESLQPLDLILGSFHSQLRKKEDQTARYVAGVRNPDVNVLGHPRGRQWNFRLGLIADWPKVFDAAAELDKAVEIDAHPNRQDLNRDLLELARESGVRISIGTDAHYKHELRYIEIGLSAAMSVGIERDRIINYMSADELIDWARSTRR